MVAALGVYLAWLSLLVAVMFAFNCRLRASTLANFKMCAHNIWQLTFHVKVSLWSLLQGTIQEWQRSKLLAALQGLQGVELWAALQGLQGLDLLAAVEGVQGSKMLKALQPELQGSELGVALQQISQRLALLAAETAGSSAAARMKRRRTRILNRDDVESSDESGDDESAEDESAEDESAEDESAEDESEEYKSGGDESAEDSWEASSDQEARSPICQDLLLARRAVRRSANARKLMLWRSKIQQEKLKRQREEQEQHRSAKAAKERQAALQLERREHAEALRRASIQALEDLRLREAEERAAKAGEELLRSLEEEERQKEAAAAKKRQKKDLHKEKKAAERALQAAQNQTEAEQKLRDQKQEAVNRRSNTTNCSPTTPTMATTSAEALSPPSCLRAQPLSPPRPSLQDRGLEASSSASNGHSFGLRQEVPESTPLSRLPFHLASLGLRPLVTPVATFVAPPIKVVVPIPKVTQDLSTTALSLAMRGCTSPILKKCPAPGRPHASMDATSAATAILRDECVVCMEEEGGRKRRRFVTFSPCGHRVVCSQCVTQFVGKFPCGLCQARVESFS